MSRQLAREPRTVHAEQCMGTVFSFDLRDPGDWSTALAEAVAWLHEVDATFSTYHDDSVISRLSRGEVTLGECSDQVREVFDLCEQVAQKSHGYFSVQAGDRLEPSGMVKGWAIQRASGILLAHGSRNHAVNGGGDIQIEGEVAPGQAWRVGISSPFDRSRILTTVTGRGFAVATSGVAERGTHIVDPHTGLPANDLACVTVVGRELTWADSYATAAFAMGAEALAWVESLAGYEALVVSVEGHIHATSGFGRVDAGR